MTKYKRLTQKLYDLNWECFSTFSINSPSKNRIEFECWRPKEADNGKGILIEHWVDDNFISCWRILQPENSIELEIKAIEEYIQS